MRLTLPLLLTLLLASRASSQGFVPGHGSPYQPRNAMETWVGTPPEECGKDRTLTQEQLDAAHAAGVGGPRQGKLHLASLIDSQGRCNLDKPPGPFQDALYGPIPTAEDLFEDLDATPLGRGYLLDTEGADWWVHDIHDHLDFRMGHVAFHGPTMTYVYYNRYGRMVHYAIHVARDQFALFDADGRRVGVIYAADPSISYRWDARMVWYYERFVYEYPYFN